MKLLKSPLRLPVATAGAYEIKHVVHEVGKKLPLVTWRQAILSGQKPEEIELTEPLTVHQLYGPPDGESGSGLLMSDSPNELVMMNDFVRKARGRVLIGGLGLGLVTRLVAAKPNVASVTVVEISEDVIALSGKGLGPKVQVVRADLFTYLRCLPAWSFDTAFFDIWYPTSELTWVSFVAPLRRIVRNRFGPRNVRSWAEPEMWGQMIRAFSHGSGQPLRFAEWSPAHYAFRKATMWKYPAIETDPADKLAELEDIVKREAMMATDPYFAHMVRTFLKEVGSRAWEGTFGVHWNEYEERKSVAAKAEERRNGDGLSYRAAC